MITGVHAILFTRDAVATRAFFSDVLGLRSVDAGEGWLIFALPPAEIAAHPAEGEHVGRHQLYLLCDDLRATMRVLKKKGATFTGRVSEEPWGSLATLKVPGGATVGLYQPRHPLAIKLKKSRGTPTARLPRARRRRPG